MKDQGSKAKELISGRQGNWWRHEWRVDGEALQYRAKVHNISRKVAAVTVRADPRSLPERFSDGHLNRLDLFY